jgi:hypothetical protein
LTILFIAVTYKSLFVTWAMFPFMGCNDIDFPWLVKGMIKVRLLWGARGTRGVAVAMVFSGKKRQLAVVDPFYGLR